MKKFLLSLLFLFFVNQSVFGASTIIENYTPDEVKNTLMKIYIKNGANIKSYNDYQIVIDEKGSFWTNVFLGTSLNPCVTLRTTYNFIKEGENTVINLNMANVVNPNNAFESTIPLKEDKIQEIVNDLQKAFNGFYGYGFTYNKKHKYLDVIKVSNKQEVLKYGDKIYKINNQDVKNLSKKAVQNELKTTQADKELNLYILRNKESFNAVTKSRFIEPTITKESL